MTPAKIENIVASTTLADSLDLNQIASLFTEAEYNPKKFPGLVFRLLEPKTALLLFHSGKANCTGGKSIQDVKESVKKVVAMLAGQGITVNQNPEVVIQNIVAVHDLGSEINLNAIALALGLENVEYEPEQFPGLVYRISNPKIVTLLFSSGKIVLTGAKKIEDINQAVEQIATKLADFIH